MHQIGVEGDMLVEPSKMQASKSDVQGYALVTFMYH